LLEWDWELEPIGVTGTNLVVWVWVWVWVFKEVNDGSVGSLFNEGLVGFERVYGYVTLRGLVEAGRTYTSTGSMTFGRAWRGWSMRLNLMVGIRLLCRGIHIHREWLAVAWKIGGGLGQSKLYLEKCVGGRVPDES
jgi:hypothetical protein